MKLFSALRSSVLFVAFAALGASSPGDQMSPANIPQPSGSWPGVALGFYQTPGYEGQFFTTANHYSARISADRIQLVVRDSREEEGTPGAPGRGCEIRFVGGRGTAPSLIRGAPQTYLHRFKGGDSAGSQTSTPAYARVQFQEIYPGIDVVYYGSGNGLEYDLVARPGADLSRIRLKVTGPDRISITPEGHLELKLGGVTWLQLKPVVYQFDDDGSRRTVEATYRRLGDQTFSLHLDGYNPRRPGVIDPVLTPAGRLGGAGEDFVRGLAVDAQENIYLAGRTLSADFPSTPGSFQPTPQPLYSDAYVVKLSKTGALLYATFLGGQFEDQAAAIAVDAEGNAYVTGFTASTNFPVTAEAYQSGLKGSRAGDLFVAKLDPTGARLIYSTYLGGSRAEIPTAIAVDFKGSAYVTGQTASFDFPASSEAFQRTFAGLNANSSDAFITKLNPAGSGLEYSSFLGSGTEQGLALALDSEGNAYLGGVTASVNFPVTAEAVQPTPGGAIDGFVSKINAGGSALLYSTYLGGTEQDFVSSITVDATGKASVAGLTASPNFPVSPNAFQPVYAGAGPQNAGDGFVAELNGQGSAILFASYVGGTGDDLATAVSRDAAGHLYLAGYTTSTNFPLVTPAQPQPGGLTDGFLIRVAAQTHQIDYATYLGGSGDDRVQALAASSAGTLFLAGDTTSTNYPGLRFTAGPGGGTDGFVWQFASATMLQISLRSATQVEISLTGEPSGGYALEASTNFFQWSTVATNRPGQSVLAFSDSLDLPYRFYRARNVP